MNRYLIKLDSPTGKMIGFTSDRFAYGTLWNYLPKGIYVDALYPIKGKEEEAIEYFLERILTLKIRTKFTCPTPVVSHHLKKHGFFFYKDQAGTPFYTNLSEKGIAALCGRLGITPDQLKQE